MLAGGDRDQGGVPQRPGDYGMANFDPDTLRELRDVRELRIRTERPPKTAVVISIHGLSPHRAIAEQYRYLEFLDTAEVMDNGLRAEKEGYDAFVLGNIFDPGLHELRELLNIPVLGLCESSVHVACLM